MCILFLLSTNFDDTPKAESRLFRQFKNYLKWSRLLEKPVYQYGTWTVNIDSSNCTSRILSFILFASNQRYIQCIVGLTHNMLSQKLTLSVVWFISFDDDRWRVFCPIQFKLLDMEKFTFLIRIDNFKDIFGFSLILSSTLGSLIHM